MSIVAMVRSIPSTARRPDSLSTPDFPLLPVRPPRRLFRVDALMDSNAWLSRSGRTQPPIFHEDGHDFARLTLGAALDVAAAGAGMWQALELGML